MLHLRTGGARPPLAGSRLGAGGRVAQQPGGIEGVASAARARARSRCLALDPIHQPVRVRQTCPAVSDLPTPDAALVRERLDAQLLRTRAATTAEQVIERILAVQAQDFRGALLAVRARSTVELADDVVGALTDRRNAVITWLNRGTLHLVRSDDYRWLHALTAPRVRPGVDRRLAQLGLTLRDVERGVGTIAGACADGGTRTRAELRHELDRAGVPVAGQALVHLLAAASLRGHVVQGPVRDGKPGFVDVATWLGPAPEPLEEHEAPARLARRYLAGHGPAAPADLAKWAGITLGQARIGFGAIAGECQEVAGGLVDILRGRSTRPGNRRRIRLPTPRLLGAFDPVLHGWVDRAALVRDHREVVTTNGVFRPTALVEGRVVGIWGLAGGRLRLELLEPIDPAAERVLVRDARAVLTYLGLPEAEPAVERRGREARAVEHGRRAGRPRRAGGAAGS
jgi:Winged helix DNA-binding domain